MRGRWWSRGYVRLELEKLGLGDELDRCLAEVPADEGQMRRTDDVLEWIVTTLTARIDSVRAEEVQRRLRPTEKVVVTVSVPMDADWPRTAFLDNLELELVDKETRLVGSRYRVTIERIPE